LNALGLISLSSIVTACPGAKVAFGGAAGPELVHATTPAISTTFMPITPVVRFRPTMATSYL